MKAPALGVVLAALSVLGAARHAQADTTAPDKASAEALFNQGIELINAGKFSEGCAKFEGSQALEPTLGTELRLADCYQRVGKTASAWALFKECEGLAHRSGEVEREQLARERIDELEPQLSYLIIESSEPELSGMRVERNGRALPAASLGAKIPVDPGAQNISVSAPGRKPWSTSLGVARSAGEVRLQLPPLAPLETSDVTAPAPAAAPQAAPVHPLEAPLTPPPTASAPQTQRTLGMLLSLAGVAGAATGLGLAGYAKYENDRSRGDAYCPEDNHNGCNDAGLTLRSRAHSFATASTITLAASGAILATGIVLWSTASKPAERQAAQSTRLSLRASAGPGFCQTTLGARF